MKKSLVALAVAGVFAAPAAFADVTISGAINMGLSYDRATDSTGTNDTGYSTFSLASNYSNFNIASVDDIGGGNSVVLNIQTAAGLNSTSATLGNRNSYLGIKGGWGGVYWGTNENIYEQYMYESDVLDGAAGMGGNLQMLGTPGGAVFEVGQSSCIPNAATAASTTTDSNGDTTTTAATTGAGTGGCVDFYRRTDNTIWYASPSWGGFSFAIDVTTNNFKSAAGSDDPRVLSAGVQFKPDGGPFYVNAAYERHGDMYGLNRVGGSGVRGAGSRDIGLQVGAGIMFGDVGIHVRAERLTYQLDNQTGSSLTEWSRDAFFVGAKIGLPSGYIGAQIGVAGDADCERANGAACAVGNDTGATMLGLGYFHNLSKQSQLQVIASFMNNGDAGTYLQAGGNNPNSGSGVDRSGLYLGIKHVF